MSRLESRVLMCLTCGINREIQTVRVNEEPSMQLALFFTLVGSDKAWSTSFFTCCATFCVFGYEAPRFEKSPV
ncbi:hypothetical protein ACU8KH_05510 [Lachancea thermotolerans]